MLTAWRMSGRLIKRLGSCCAITDDEPEDITWSGYRSYAFGEAGAVRINQMGRDQDENPGVRGMSSHLYKERKGGPAPVWFIIPGGLIFRPKRNSITLYADGLTNEWTAYKEAWELLRNYR